MSMKIGIDVGEPFVLTSRSILAARREFGGIWKRHMNCHYPATSMILFPPFSMNRARLNWKQLLSYWKTSTPIP